LHHPGLGVTITIIKTTGDRVLDSPLSLIGDKGLFTREIEHALLEGTIDLAVHSLKDLPTELPAGLTLGAVTEREDVRDVFLPHPANRTRTLLDQPAGARIATGSLRRRSQMLALRPDFVIEEIRGNLNTRFTKLGESAWDGMLLARAGVVRLGWEDRIGETIPVTTILPAVGQGALGIEVREGDTRVLDAIAPLHHALTAAATRAERAFLRRLEGGCQVPIGTHGRMESKDDGPHRLALDAVVGALDGSRIVRGSAAGDPDRPEQLGRSLAEKMLGEGADVILRAIRPGMQGGTDR
jgi:hydroxymethylbilane synthase